MTTLAAIQGDGWTVIGCDSRASDDDGRFMELATSKIINNNGVLIAVSGASRGGNITQFGWKPPKPRVAEDLDVFMTKKFIPSMRKAFQDAGFEGKEDGDAAFHDSNLLISIRGIIYPIFSDYSWDREARNVYYGGSGGDIALGALEALDYTKAKTPAAAEKILRRAIEAACKHDIYSGGKILTHIQEA
jgi:ATP-dependent protease HslVU (ClpYQ) peptidase subunit